MAHLLHDSPTLIRSELLLSIKNVSCPGCGDAAFCGNYDNLMKVSGRPVVLEEKNGNWVMRMCPFCTVLNASWLLGKKDREFSLLNAPLRQKDASCLANAISDGRDLLLKIVVIP